MLVALPLVTVTSMVFEPLLAAQSKSVPSVLVIVLPEDGNIHGPTPSPEILRVIVALAAFAVAVIASPLFIVIPL